MSNLVLKVSSGDTGTLPRGGVLWACESLKLIGDNQSTYGYGATAAGRPTQVLVEATNTGRDIITEVQLDAWVCDFTFGYIGPGSAIRQVPSDPASPPLAFNGYISQIPAMSTVNRLLDPVWTPTAAQAKVNEVTEPDGTKTKWAHVCIGAVAYGYSLGKMVGSPLTTAGVDVANRTEHGWRNIQVFAVPKGSEALVLQGATLHNPHDKQGLELDVTLMSVPGELDEHDLNHINSGRYGGREYRKSPLPPIDFGIDDRERPMTAGEGALTVVGRWPRPRSKKFKLRAKQKKQVYFKARLSELEEPGNVHVFDAISRDVDGAIIGGARLLVLVEE